MRHFLVGYFYKEIRYGERDDGSVIAQSTHLILQRDNNTIPIGNYTLGISASDAKVTKSIFRNLLVKQGS